MERLEESLNDEIEKIERVEEEEWVRMSYESREQEEDKGILGL